MTLLIDHGDLPSLAAATLEAKPESVHLFHPRGDDPAIGRREAAVRRHGQLLGGPPVIVDTLAAVELGAAPRAAAPAGELRDVQILLRAVEAALRLGLTRIVAPVAVGPDAERVGAAVQRAAMVAAISRTGPAPAAGVAIELPLVDLTDEQIVNLAEDAGAPMELFWPCSAGAARACDACGGCRRWRQAFDAAGIEWPL